MTGESWAEVIARPIIAEQPLAVLYFVSYILVTSIVLMNVVIAVLLEKMVTEDESDDEEGDDDDDGFDGQMTLAAQAGVARWFPTSARWATS